MYINIYEKDKLLCTNFKLEFDAARERACGVHASRPRRQSVEHVVSVAVGKVGADLGCLRTESANGPKTKFAHLSLLYNFC
jgi:hypothetical protein